MLRQNRFQAFKSQNAARRTRSDNVDQMHAMLAVLQDQIQRIGRRLRELELGLQIGLVVVKAPMNCSEDLHELGILHQTLQIPVYIAAILRSAQRVIWKSRQNENSRNRGFLWE